MKLRFFFLLMAFLFFAAGRAQSPEPASDILQEAFKQAAKEKKNVFLIFHASWCGWCHKMDAAMNDKKVKAFFDSNYVIRHLTVYESENNKNLENPGALELLTKYKGKDEGIPYWLVFDKNGTLVADSKLKTEGSDKAGKNVGCPATKEEVAYFITVL